MWQYRQRVGRDVTRWARAGYITTDGEAAIRAELAKETGPGLASLLSILGAVLLGFAAMSFVASNWDAMPKLARLALLSTSVAASYGLAGWLARRGMAAFAQAAILLGCCLFGAGIMLIAQMYHIDGHPPDAALSWMLGSLAAGLIVPSNPALVLAMLLVVLWTGWEMVLRDAVFWPFLAGWSAVTAGFGWQRWRPGLVLAAVVLAGWIVTLGYTVSDDHPHEIVVTLGLMLAGASLFGLRAFPDHRRDLATGVGFGLAIAFCGLFAIQFFETRTVIELIAAAAMTLLLTLGAVAWGWRNGNRGLTWAGYGGFSVEILALYFETVGSLLGSSLFFLAAGALVTVLAWVAYRLGRAEPNPDPEEETAP